MNRYDKFFSKLTLVSFQGGAMGSFLINFLNAENPELYAEFERREFFGLRTNHEWSVLYYFQGIQNLDVTVLDQLKEYYGKNTYIQQTLYAYGRLVENLCKERKWSTSLVKSEFTFERALELVKEDYDYDSLLFPYVKNHLNERNFQEKSVPYKKKIYCYFPKGKQWIISAFVLYKHHLYKIFHKNNNYDYGTGDVKNWIRYYQDNIYFDPMPINYTDHESLDMYELVFNKNLDGLRKIYPDFEPGELQLELLNQAHDTSMMVLNDLNISHELIITEFGAKKFLDQTGLIDVLRESLALERKKQ
jgi:hypothetical protein